MTYQTIQARREPGGIRVRLWNGRKSMDDFLYRRNNTAQEDSEIRQIVERTFGKPAVCRVLIVEEFVTPVVRRRAP